MALMAQLVFWWLFLFLAVDVEGKRHGCCCYKLLYDKLRKCCSCCNDDKPRTGEIVPETKFVQGKGKGANGISSNRRVEEPPMPSIKAENVAISEPHVNSCLCIVCRRGNTLTEARSLEIDTGELKVIYGPSGSGKTQLMNKLASLSTPMVSSGKIRRRDEATVVSQDCDDVDIDGGLTVKKHVENMALIGGFKPSTVIFNLQKLGLGDLLETRVG